MFFFFSSQIVEHCYGAEKKKPKNREIPNNCEKNNYIELVALCQFDEHFTKTNNHTVKLFKVRVFGSDFYDYYGNIAVFVTNIKKTTMNSSKRPLQLCTN